MNKNKILGMLIGGAIGDAMGMPVESWSAQKIAEKYPDGITGFNKPDGHKWFDGTTLPGTITDDTQLTIATMRGLMNGHRKACEEGSVSPYMDAIAKAHADALAITDAGWGKSTREAVTRLANNCHWSESGKTDKKSRGTGNGIPMKISPLPAWYASPASINFVDPKCSFNQFCVNFSAMTHYNKMSAHAAVIHARAIYYCLWCNPQGFNQLEFLDLISKVCFKWGEKDGDYNVDHLNDPEDSLADRMNILYDNRRELTSMDAEKIQELFGDGSCYVYTSLPFTYAHFLRNTSSAFCIQETIEAGGDTDTNAKMVGEMLGALHGIELFELPQNKWMTEGLPDYQELIGLGNEFCKIMEITDGLEAKKSPTKR